MAELWARGGCRVHPATADGAKVPAPVEGGSEDVYPALYPSHYESGPRRGQPHPQAGQPHRYAGQHKYGWKRLASGDLVYPWHRVRADLRGKHDGIGVFCGAASGGLEMLELEGRAVHLVEVLAARAAELGILDLWHRLEQGCSETSPTGGIHWYLRVVGGDAKPNTKLAMRPNPDDPKKPAVFAETRGSGGWVVVAGSFGRTHVSGKPYRMRSGSPLTIPGFTAAERDTIHDLFRTLDEMPELTRPAHELRPLARRDRPAGDLLPGDDFDLRGSWEEALPAGWARVSQGGKSDAWSMHGLGGRKTADLYHESQSLYIYDTECPGSQRKLSRFAAYAWLQFGGDFHAAAAALYAAGYGSRREKPAPGEEQAAPPVRVEQLDPAQPGAVSLDDWRREASAAVAKVVADWKDSRDFPGVNLLRGEPGTGKTYAVAEHSAKLPRGVTTAPSHELCEEIVEQLQGLGVDAAAYPKLDETTCRNWGNAERALAAGLPVAACICSSCPMKRECRVDGYLAGVRQAESTPHRVVTHERFARTAARLTKRAHYVTIEEDPSSILRPSRSAGARALGRVADLVEQLVEAAERKWILEGADLVVEAAGRVEAFAEFESWAVEEEPQDTGEAPGATGDDLEVERQRQFPGGFLGRLGCVAELLAGRCRSAVRSGVAVGMHEIDLPAPAANPKSPEWLVWRALEDLRRVDPHGVPEITPEMREALALVLYAATGRLRELYVQVEADEAGGEEPAVRSARVVGYWRVSVPADRIPVFVNDGTSDRRQVERLVGEHLAEFVRDLTPPGRIELAQPCEHYPVDILPTTSPQKVARILAGIVRAHPDWERVGVVFLKSHYDRLICPGDGEEHLLPIDVWDRLAKVTYYGSGADRGTNRFHNACDAVVVLGTFRPPPREIRRRLVQLGEIEAANAQGTWGGVERHAIAPDGAETTYQGRGYAEELWAAAADSLTRAAVRQAVGRARAICPNGVPLAVCSTERLGLPVLPADRLPVVDERVDRVLAAVSDSSPDCPSSGQLASKNPNSVIRVSGRKLGSDPAAGVSLEQIVERLPGVPLSTVRKWISRAVESGKVVRSGRTWQTRYALAPDVVVPPIPAAPARAAPVVETIEDPPPPPPAPVLKLEPVVVVEHLEPAPVEQLEHPLDDPMLPATPDDPPERWWPWLAAAIAPERFPREVEDLRFIRASAALRLGDRVAWDSVCTPEIVPKLYAVATREAHQRGQEPPPVEIVARHTTAWYVATPDIWSQ